MVARVSICAADLQAAATRIKSLRQQSTENAIEIGRELLRVKESLPHGVFARWVESECEFKIRMAQDLMKLAREANTNPDIVTLLGPSTLRIFLSKSTPPAVQQFVRSRLKNGEKVSRTELRNAISEAKAKPAAERTQLRQAAPRSSVGDLLSTGDFGNEMDRSKRIATLLIQRLNQQDIDYLMEGINWGIWNRVLIWLRAASVEPDGAQRPGFSKVRQPSVAPAA